MLSVGYSCCTPDTLLCAPGFSLTLTVRSNIYVTSRAQINAPHLVVLHAFSQRIPRKSDKACGFSVCFCFNKLYGFIEDGTNNCLKKKKSLEEISWKKPNHKVKWLIIRINTWQVKFFCRFETNGKTGRHTENGRRRVRKAGKDQEIWC